MKWSICKAALLVILGFLIFTLSISLYGDRNIEVYVETDKLIYQVEEPIQITITAYNPTSETITLIFSWLPQTNYHIDDIFSYIPDYSPYGLPVVTYINILPFDEFSWERVHHPHHYFLNPGSYEITGVVGVTEHHGSGSTTIYVSFTSVDDDILDQPMTGKFALRNYPNPFNPQTNITFALPDRREVTLIVYDILGHQVEVLLDEELDAGEHKVIFDASGKASGVYFYLLKAGDDIEYRKMLHLK